MGDYFAKFSAAARGSGNTRTLATTVGKITIPALTANLPLITNGSGNVVTLADNNTISGFQIENSGAGGIYGSAIHGLIVQDNRFSANLISPSVGLFDTTGAISINNSFVFNAPTGSVLPHSNGILIENSDIALTFPTMHSTT